ncbi:MAG: hypothetical protein IJQ39_09180 [Thermoguttaceae bacterium]|nr:hypothetical protein [Thermoguttaceae bacterium]
MKRFIAALAAVTFSASLFLTAGCDFKIPGLNSTQEQTEEESKGKSDGKGKFEMTEEVPPAPGDEQFISQKQDQKQPQKQSQKQSQKQDQKQDQK